MNYRILWTKEVEGECLVRANNKIEAEIKAEIGKHGKISPLKGVSADWVIKNVQEW